MQDLTKKTTTTIEIPLNFNFPRLIPSLDLTLRLDTLKVTRIINEYGREYTSTSTKIEVVGLSGFTKREYILPIYYSDVSPIPHGMVSYKELPAELQSMIAEITA